MIGTTTFTNNQKHHFQSVITKGEVAVCNSIIKDIAGDIYDNLRDDLKEKYTEDYILDIATEAYRAASSTKAVNDPSGKYMMESDQTHSGEPIIIEFPLVSNLIESEILELKYSKNNILTLPKFTKIKPQKSQTMPLSTTKPKSYKLEELILFKQGDTGASYFKEHGISGHVAYGIEYDDELGTVYVADHRTARSLKDSKRASHDVCYAVKAEVERLMEEAVIAEKEANKPVDLTKTVFRNPLYDTIKAAILDESNLTTLVYGDTQCGKNTTLKMVAEELGYLYYDFPCTQGTLAGDFLGRINNAISGQFVDGPLPRLMKAEQGAIFHFSEFTCLTPEVAARLNMLLEKSKDGTRSITIEDDNGNIVKSTPKFRVVFSCNNWAGSDVSGMYASQQNPVDAAMVARVDLVLRMTYDPDYEAAVMTNLQKHEAEYLKAYVSSYRKKMETSPSLACLPFTTRGIENIVKFANSRNFMTTLHKLAISYGWNQNSKIKAAIMLAVINKGNTETRAEALELFKLVG